MGHTEVQGTRKELASSLLLNTVVTFHLPHFFPCISTALHVFKAQLNFISLLKLLVSLGVGCFISTPRVESSARSVFFLACASVTPLSTVQEMSDKDSQKMLISGGWKERPQENLSLTRVRREHPVWTVLS